MSPKYEKKSNEDILNLLNQAERAEKKAAQDLESLKKTVALERVKMTKDQTMTFQKQREDLIQSLSNSPYVKGLQQQFLTTIFPMGGAIINMAYNLYNATPPIMTETQRDKLVDIGDTIVNLPKKMLSGEYDIKQGFQTFVGALSDLTDFITDPENLNIVINIGALLLESIHPLGAFIKETISNVFDSGMPKNAEETMMRGLSTLTKQYTQLEQGLQTAVESQLHQENSATRKHKHE